MKICLLSASTKNIDWNNYGHPEWFDITRPNHQAYADKWGWDYTYSLIDNHVVSDRHPTWLKIKELSRVVDIAIKENKWDWIVWIDADACFTNLDVDFTKWLNYPESNHHIVLPKMQPDPNHGKCWTKLSTGVMAVKASTYIQSLLKKMWQSPNDFRYGGFHEQSWLDLFYSSNMTRCENLNTSSINDIQNPIALDKLLVIPYKWHLTTLDNDIPCVYHAGGDTPSKSKRIKQALCI